MHTPEFFEKKDICKYLDEIGAWHFKPAMNGYGGSGVPDIVGCYRGRFFAIEVKREGKLPTKLQEKRMRDIQAAGGEVFWGIAKKVNSEIEAWRECVPWPHLAQ